MENTLNRQEMITVSKSEIISQCLPLLHVRTPLLNSLNRILWQIMILETKTNRKIKEVILPKEEFWSLFNK